MRTKLDQGSIRLSLRCGYSLNIRNSARMFHHVLLNMGDLYLVLPALKLSTLNAGISIMMGSLEQFSVSPRPLGFGFGFGTKGFGA